MISPLDSHALRAMTPRTSVAVDRSRCVRHRCRQNDCRRCMEACPSGAIGWNERGLFVSSHLCTQCLRCLSVCPTAALKSPEFSLHQGLSDLAAHPEPVLGCQRSQFPAHARFPCLGNLAHPELMLVLALVFKDGLQINLSGCSDCPKGHILEPILSTETRLSEIDIRHRLRLVLEEQALDYRPPGLSRRELFSLLGSRSKRTAQVVVERLQADVKTVSYGTKEIPPIRSMLLRTMETLQERERQRISHALFGEVCFTSSCTACGGCAGICPTGAIEPADGKGNAPLFNAAKCVTCLSCSAFCRKKGVGPTS